MAVFKCKMCGGSIDIEENATIGTCEYCNTKQTFPKYTDEKRSATYEKAGELRRGNQFDSASSFYHELLKEDNTDAEAYWSLVLCRYGIEYVEDPQTHKRVPTVNRAQFVSIFDDEDYKAAILHADPLQRSVYQDEAQQIDTIQKRILSISQAEEPFDVFICYKETDEDGKRTRDSVYATQIYHMLTKEGYKVFFSRITLEDKLGIEYEPYIFAALHSAKIMIVVGTSPAYFDAVWVKNEWSRYLALIAQGERKTLIPAFRDMDPSEMPEEFAYLQGLNMDQLGFSQDLLHGIKKILGGDSSTASSERTASASTGSNASHTNSGPEGTTAADNALFVDRAQKLLEAKDYFNLQSLCRNQLVVDPNSVVAYQYKLFAQFKISSLDALPDLFQSYEGTQTYKKLYSLADNKLRKKLDELSEQHKQKILPQIPLLVDAIRRQGLFLLLWGCYVLIASILDSLDFGKGLSELRAAMPVISTFLLAVFLAGIRCSLVWRSEHLMQFKLYRISAKIGMVGGIVFFFVTLLSCLVNSSEMEWIIASVVLVGLLLAFIFLVDVIAGILALIQFATLPADIKLKSGETALGLWRFFIDECKAIFQKKKLIRKD